MHAKTPRAITDRQNKEIVWLISLPDVKEKLLGNEAETVGNTPDEFAALIKADTTRISKVIKDAGIKVNWQCYQASPARRPEELIRNRVGRQLLIRPKEDLC